MIGKVIGVSLIIGMCFQLGWAEKILAVFSYCFPSPFLMVTPYMKALVAKGHELTIISGRVHLPDIEGAHHIRVEKLDVLMKGALNIEFKKNIPNEKWQKASIISRFFHNSSIYILSDPGVQALLHGKNSHFDMVIVQASLTDALYGFGQHFNAPLVGIMVYGTAWNIDFLAGNMAPSVYEPMSSGGYMTGLGLREKLKNWIFITEEWLLEKLVHLPSQVPIYERFFNRSAESLYQIRRNFALVLINQHFSLGRARSNVPNVVEVAGMHLEQPYPELDEELKRFVNDAEHGVVVFSMGLDIKKLWLPPNWAEILQKAFEPLSQRIVWKYELPLPNISSHIYTRPMLPQRALMEHPNVKLLVTHGGIMSIIEGAYYGKPMLCLPLYYDQFGNAELMKHAGVAKSLDIGTMTADALRITIQELLDNPAYTYKAKQMSTRLKDQPMSPLETALWWTEYVLRHKGAPHMRISEEDISFIQYYNLDFIFIFFLRFVLLFFIVTCVSLKVASFLMQRSQIRLSVPVL